MPQARAVGGETDEEQMSAERVVPDCGAVPDCGVTLPDCGVVLPDCGALLDCGDAQRRAGRRALPCRAAGGGFSSSRDELVPSNGYLKSCSFMFKPLSDTTCPCVV